jgi:transcriptional regulator GlxA family with amidase domain
LQTQKRGGRKGKKQKKEGLIAEVYSRILEKIDTPFGTNDLALALNISESHLRARFRRETGMSLGHYIRRTRLTHAASLLWESSYRITEVAARCGFGSVYAFSRAFKREYGLSPKAYRQQAHAGDRHLHTQMRSNYVP